MDNKILVDEMLIDKALASATKRAIKKHGSINDVKGLRSYVAIANQYGVPDNDIITLYLFEYHVGDDQKQQKKMNSINNMLYKWCDQKGSNPFNVEWYNEKKKAEVKYTIEELETYEVEKDVDSFDADETHELKDDQYLSDLPIQYMNKKQISILSPAGSGKTHAMLCNPQLPKVIMCVPTIPLGKSKASDFDIPFYYGGNRNFSNTDKHIVTYDSLKLDVEYLKKHNLLDDYTLVVDEAHSKVSEDYRYTALRSIHNLAKEFKQVIYLSATPIESSIFAECYKIKVTGSEKKLNTKWIEVGNKNDLYQLIENGLKNKKAGESLFVYNDNKKEIKFLENYYQDKGYSVTSYYQGKDRSEEMKTLTVDHHLQQSDLIFGTRFIHAGLDIYDAKISKVIINNIDNVLSPVTLKQLLYRFRDLKELDVDIITQKKEYIETTPISEDQMNQQFVDMQKMLNHAVNYDSWYAENIFNTLSNNNNNNRRKKSLIESAMYKMDNGYYIYDAYSVSMIQYHTNQRLYNIDAKQYLNALATYNIYIDKFETYEAEENIEVKKDIKATKQKTKKLEDEKFVESIENINRENYDQHKYDKDLNKIALVYDEIHDRIGDPFGSASFTIAKNAMRKNKRNKQAWERFDFGLKIRGNEKELLNVVGDELFKLIDTDKYYKCDELIELYFQVTETNEVVKGFAEDRIDRDSVTQRTNILRDIKCLFSIDIKNGLTEKIDGKTHKYAGWCLYSRDILDQYRVVEEEKKRVA